MEHLLIDLPFEKNALEPAISQKTLEFHHGKHHAGYVNNLNKLIKDTPYEKMRLKEVVVSSDGSIFNNAAQVYNHNFYFEGMSSGNSALSDALYMVIQNQYGSLEHLKESFLDAAVKLFGSGWVWLCIDSNGKLLIKSYSNAGNPLLDELTPLLTCDVWEHAYYIDYRNARAAYLEKWWELINWDFVSQNLDQE